MGKRFVACAVIVAAVVGCAAPSAEDFDRESCTSDGSDSLYRRVNPGPNCDGFAHARECEFEGLPSAYGVESGCDLPALYQKSSKTCVVRQSGLADCVAFRHIVCCPA